MQNIYSIFVPIQSPNNNTNIRSEHSFIISLFTTFLNVFELVPKTIFLGLCRLLYVSTYKEYTCTNDPKIPTSHVHWSKTHGCSCVPVFRQIASTFFPVLPLLFPATFLVFFCGVIYCRLHALLSRLSPLIWSMTIEELQQKGEKLEENLRSVIQERDQLRREKEDLLTLCLFVGLV